MNQRRKDNGIQRRMQGGQIIKLRDKETRRHGRRHGEALGYRKRRIWRGGKNE